MLKNICCDNNNVECPICFIPVKWDSIVCKAKGCSCVYHKKCFNKWNKINKSGKCIICTNQIIYNNLNKLQLEKITDTVSQAYKSLT